MKTSAFYLGALPRHIGKTSAPLFVSRRQLSKRRALPKASGPWALDSGGFTELSKHGRWTISAAEYVDEVRRLADGVGRMDWAAPQDWMCEPEMLRLTGKNVAEHQRLTVDNLLELRARAPDLPFIPVLQGWTRGQYLDHVDLYQAAGIDLKAERLVGVGSICRRQNTMSAGHLLMWLASDGLSLHAFGFKVAGLRMHHEHIASADSMAWSFAARRRQERLSDCSHKAKDCRTCINYALEWRADVLASIERN